MLYLTFCFLTIRNFEGKINSTLSPSIKLLKGAKKVGKTIEKDKSQNTTVIRTERGLTIAGTRITLYSVMDYVKADWPTELIKNWMNITDEQITGVMDYIEAHREEVEAEYEIVLQQAEEIRQYWEERNRERFAQIAAMPPKPGQEEIRAKLRARKAKWEQS